jgi:hypothetical protein
LVLLGFLGVVVALAAVGARVAGPALPLSPRDIASGEYSGRSVTVAGRVVSQARGSLILSPEDADAPTIEVSIPDDTGRRSYGPGVLLTVSGTASGAAAISDAVVLWPTGPSKYQEANQ